MNRLHMAARQWATCMSIFPCLPDAKQPATRNGFKDATQDLSVVDEWWTENPDYNIAVCPADAGFFVLDIDGEEGEKQLQEWEMMYGQIPPTLQVRTPRGGRHIWLRGGLIGSSVSKFGPKIDIRGVGGYVLVPPSRIKGFEYAFLTP